MITISIVLLVLLCLIILKFGNSTAALTARIVGTLTGAERKPTANGTNGIHPKFKLSRPLNKIIEDTFREEFTKIKRDDLDSIEPGKVRNIKERIENIGKPQSSAECLSPKSLESAIQTTHKEIVSTLELILMQSNEIKSSLLGEKINKMNEEIKIEATDQVRVLTLNHAEHQDSTIYRLEKGWIVQFRLGPSLLGRKVSLYCNYPRTGDFKRNRYFQVVWCQDEGCQNADDTALYSYIKVKISGSFHYYFTYDDRDTSEHQGSGFFLVDPVLKYGNNESLPLDCVQSQTILAKSLGEFKNWEGKLRVTKETGYNMIHFTPIQELGESNSSYSLKEQLKLNPIFDGDGKNVSIDDVEKFVAKIRKDWKITSICDIVLNHTANESTWLVEHPEATYNCKNCPYMRPAYLLDAALQRFDCDVRNGVYEHRGVPAEINCEDHLNSIRYILQTDVLNQIKLQEMFICDVSKLVTEFALLARNKVPRRADSGIHKELHLQQDPEHRRLSSKIDMETALFLYNIYRNDCFDEESRIKRCTEDFKARLDALNKFKIDKLSNDLIAAIDNTIAGIRYFRVQSDGPKIKEISSKNPLIYRYFTDFGRPQTLDEYEDLMYGPNCKYLMAHNGWVMDSDPLQNFASDVKVYLRRELIAWGDSVKLRYGDKPEDCPFLWKHMRAYVEMTARIFDGVRLDNCHSTPIPVAEFLLDCARRIRPDLYVVAELFTNSDQKDNIFVNRLGITSLIREAMSAWDSHEQGRLVYRYGGYPVGAFYQPNTRPLVPSVAHALFLDLSHDNPSPVEKRSVFDLLPSTSLVNMACCASGSNRGYDELVPHHIHVVDETREYTEWADKDVDDGSRFVTRRSGIIAAKRALNDLHFYLGSHGFNQVYVDQVDCDIVAVTRHNPISHESVILVAFTSFQHPNETDSANQRYIKPLRVEGVLDEIILEATLSSKKSKYAKCDDYIQDNKYINGLANYQIDIKQHVNLDESDMLVEGNSGDLNVLQLDFKNFKKGSVVAIKVSLSAKVRQSVKNIRGLIENFNNQNDLKEIVRGLNLSDLNRALYRCDQEDRDEGFAAYDIPNFGPMVYCGLQGIVSLLGNIRPENDLGHPMCSNLRAGNWLLEYTLGRLKSNAGTESLGLWIEKNVRDFNIVPRYLIPAYFDAVITGIYLQLIGRALNLMSDFIKKGSVFVRGLGLGSVQFGALVKSSPLPTLSPKLAVPVPESITIDGSKMQACVSLSAGLPHFATGYMRNWGRDTFIALRGLFILTGRHQEARYHILGYGACLRHGLIPNLLDGGKNSRFNCRDAVWWWLYCIQCYVQEVPNGTSILSDKVSRIFPNDEAPAQEPGTVDQMLFDVIQEAMRIHFQGLVFRERNAGRKIDEHMTDKGFNNQIGVHPETGFVFGGNDANCGTWMDKMGSSDKAGNRGKPATPRDGSAVELIGLSKSVISWLSKLYLEKKYPYDSVERKHKNGTFTKWTYKEWAEKIQKNFEKHFWVGNDVKNDLVNKRGIYKDCYGASQAWTDYQLRCNFPIAMVAAPELFDPENAWKALKMAEEHLLGPLGMKTLDESDWNYCGDYDNSNDSSDPKIANGFNYHQGPEWVWPIGFYLRAKLIFAPKAGQLKATLASTKQILSKHFVELQTSPWKGLPELTNKDGSYCKDSSRTQAWSMSAILEVLHDLQKIESKEPLNIN